MRAWLKGLLVTAIGGATTGAADALQRGQLGKSAGVAAAAGAMTTVVAYLLQSPLRKTSAQPTEEK